MAGQIGSESFTTWKGWLYPAQQKIATITGDQGVDGLAVVLGGFAADSAQIQTTATVADLSAAQAKINAYRLLHGQAVAVVDQFGVSFPGVVVLGVRTQPAQTVFGGGFRVTATWTLLVQTDRPT
jgi:hypothetical protein